MELKPCPFCKIGKVDVKGGGDTYLYFTRCRKCGAIGPSAQTESGAIEAWNTRPEVDALRAELEQARAFLKPLEEGWNDDPDAGDILDALSPAHDA